MKFKDTSFPIEERVQDLLERMTLKEKLMLMIETSAANERLGIPKYYHGNEALHGVVRPGKFTVFPQAIGGWYDIVVCMYHDQGHIPTKVQGFVYDREKQQWNAVAGVNITLGLPIIRTSVDHGTAFEIAGQGIASESSFRQAIYTALDVYRSRLVDKAIHARPLRKLYHEKHDDSHTLRLDQED